MKLENTVELLGIYGSDETHALSAWTSTARELTDEKKNRIPQLLKMLASEGHETPFEKSSLHFLVKTDISTHIQLLKHRIGTSINGQSARYKELKEDNFYVPSDWPHEERELYIQHMEDSLKKYHEALNRLTASGMSRSRAKESARFYIPYGKQLTADVMFNWRSFNHFLKLRYSSHAQLEIRQVARKMLELVFETGQFDETMRAFGWINDVDMIMNPKD